MNTRLEADILAASQPLRVPGQGEQRVLSPAAVERLAAAEGVGRWAVEATALEAGVTPLHYLRNLARFEAAGQVRLLRSSVAVVGMIDAVVGRVLELLALDGVGRLIPCIWERPGSPQARYLVDLALNRNASCEIDVRTLPLRSGDPRVILRDVGVVVGCLDNQTDEQLLQAACKMLKLPLVLGGVEGSRGQATTILPGDPGTALVYNFRHPHLEPRRGRAEVDSKAALVVAGWLAEQATALILEKDDLLRHRLLYADLDTGEMTAYPL